MDITKKSELLALKNVGPATVKDLHTLGIVTVQQLAQQNASELYRRLEMITGIHHDPCVWDVFAAAIHESQTGERLAWWAFTPVRKKTISKLCHHEQSKRLSEN